MSFTIISEQTNVDYIRDAVSGPQFTVAGNGLVCNPPFTTKALVSGVVLFTASQLDFALNEDDEGRRYLFMSVDGLTMDGKDGFNSFINSKVTFFNKAGTQVDQVSFKHYHKANGGQAFDKSGFIIGNPLKYAATIRISVTTETGKSI